MFNKHHCLCLNHCVFSHPTYHFLSGTACLLLVFTYVYGNLTFWDCTRTGRVSMCYHFLLPGPADSAHGSWYSFLLSQCVASKSFPIQVAASFSVSSLEMKCNCCSLPKELHGPLGHETGLLGSISTSLFGDGRDTTKHLISSAIFTVYKYLLRSL